MNLRRCKPLLPRWRASRAQHLFDIRWSSSSEVSTLSSSISSQAEIASARKYCLDMIRRYDLPSSLLAAYIPRHARDAYIALRAFNIEVARTADTTSTPTIGSMRLQFQRDAVANSLSGRPPKQPIAILLAHAAEKVFERTGGQRKWNKSWFMRIIDARERYLSNPPYASLEALEKYAENAYSSLLYLTLQALPMASVTADHVASHIGKATGIVTVLRGLPLLAFPGPANTHSNQGGHLGGDIGASKHGAVTLPLDIMVQTGVREEDVLRNGSGAKGLKDAVFAVATRANDHLITAQHMLANIQAGEDVGHDFEHQDEEEHVQLGQLGQVQTPSQEIERAFGVFMPAVATRLWLNQLEKLDFDIFAPDLRVTGWRLPWDAFWSYRRRHL